MSGIINSLVNEVLGAPPWLVYLIIALVVFAEDALFVGFVLPGETLAIIGGVTASLGHTSLTWVLVVVILAAIIGAIVLTLRHKEGVKRQSIAVQVRGAGIVEGGHVQMKANGFGVGA